MLEPPMRERIAQAIWDTWRVSPHGNEDSAALEWDQIRGVDQTQYPTLASCVETAFAEADAVLESMRRPTTPMLAAAQTAWLKDPMRRTSTLWDAMIEAAIKEGKDENA